MTHINATVPRNRQINEWRESLLMKTELDFWRDRAREYASELENIFDHASETGHIEVWRGSEKIDLYTKTTPEGA